MRKIIDLIPTGKKNAIRRQALLSECIYEGIAGNDREMRRLIEEARKEAVILNMQDGKGYFIPSKEDIAELQHYVAQERNRSISISRNLRIASNLLADMETGRI